VRDITYARRSLIRLMHHSDQALTAMQQVNHKLASVSEPDVDRASGRTHPNAGSYSGEAS
jgi:hypothetical protein